MLSRPFVWLLKFQTVPSIISRLFGTDCNRFWNDCLHTKGWQINSRKYQLNLEACQHRYFCDFKTSDNDEVSDISCFYSQPDAVSVIEPDDSYAHFRIQLFPKDTDPILSYLYEATTVQQVFDQIEELDQSGELTEQHCIQALVTLWDLQKLLNKIGPLYDPEKHITNQEHFISEIRSHPVFANIIFKSVVDNYKKLEDESLVVSLLCLKRIQFDVRSSLCEKFITECINRKDSLALPAISRLGVCLKTESMYGSVVLAKFVPLLLEKCKSMNDDVEVRLVSIALRNSQRILTEEVIKVYRERLDKIIDVGVFETVTLCKVFIFLIETKTIGDDPSSLMRKVGNILASKVKSMPIIEILTLQRFMEIGSNEPYPLVEALISRIGRLIEEHEPPRLDLLACISPFLKSVQLRQKISNFISRYLDNCKYFESVDQVLYRILRSIRTTDRALHDKYWDRVLEVVSTQADDVSKVIRYALDYMNISQNVGVWYRHTDFEARVKDLLTLYVKNYLNLAQPAIISPAEYGRAFAFLLAFASSPTDAVFQDVCYLYKFEDFSGQFRVADLCNVARGVDMSLQFLSHQKSTSSKYYDQIRYICSILEEQCSLKMLHENNELSTLDFLAIGRLHSHIYKVTGYSPIFHGAIEMAVSHGIEDSRMARELSNCLLVNSFNSSGALKALSIFIDNNKENTSPGVAEKFASVAFAMGLEYNDSSSHLFHTCYSIIERHSDKINALGLLQCSLALCFYRCLQPNLVHSIFSVDFIDQIDTELTSFSSKGLNPMKIRHSFMELNRAVCIDMPDANVPWFHNKFCQQVISMESIKDSHLHNDVFQIVSQVLGDTTAVQRNLYSSYYYLLDFVVEFDAQNRPIRKFSQKRRLFSFQKEANPPTIEVRDKVAILILPNSAFTKNVRNLKGFYKLRQRHLEIESYRVVHIDPQQWNSMYMSEPSAKHDFIESRLFSMVNKYKSDADDNRNS